MPGQPNPPPWDPSQTDHTYNVFEGIGKYMGLGNPSADPFFVHLAKDTGMVNEAPANAPGFELPTGQSEEDKKRLADYIAALKRQQETGEGAWTKQQFDATQAAQAAGTAAAQAPGASQSQALHRMQQARSAAAMQGTQQQALLSEQAKMGATGALQDVYAGQMAADARQAAQQAAARQARAEANQAAEQAGAKTMQGVAGGVAQAIPAVIGALAMLSDGGEVPGKPKVFGDSEKNDTVPAMLSPGEIVIPRSLAKSPNAAQKAAHFVAAVKAKGGANRYADGGPATSPYGQLDSSGKMIDDPSLPKDRDLLGSLSATSTPHQASVERGSILENQGYNASRKEALGNLEKLGAQAYGFYGPSAARAQQQIGVDQMLGQALAAHEKGASPDIATRAALATSGTGAEAARARLGESQRAMQQATGALAGLRQQDLSFAQAQQEAAMRNSLMNIGIGLQEQQAIRGLLSGAGQGAMGLAGQLGKGKTGSASTGSAPESSGGGDVIEGGFNESDTDWEAPSEPGDYNPPDISEGEYASKGGRVVSKRKRTADFLRAVGGR